MGGSDRPHRILLVDDDEDVQALGCRLLGNVGYNVESAHEGREAIERIEASKPELVVLDLVMPGLDGWGVLRYLKGLPSPPPVVLLTVLADPESFRRAVQEGASAYVVKPLHFHELVATCQRVLLFHGRQRRVPVERRAYTRRVFIVAVTASARRGVASGELVNLSRGGAQVRLETALEPGDHVSLAAHLAAQDSPLILEGRVQWRESAPTGFSHGLALGPSPPEADGGMERLLGEPRR